MAPDTEGWWIAASPGFTRAVFMGVQHLNYLKGETASDCAAEIQKALLTVGKKNPPQLSQGWAK